MYGAMISGRRTFDIANGWKDGHPIDVPNFVVTHNPPTSGEWHSKVEFVTEGVERAVALARCGRRRSRGIDRLGDCRATVASSLGSDDDDRIPPYSVVVGAGGRQVVFG